MSWAEYRDLKPRLPSIEELVAFRMAPLNVGEAGRTERTYAQLVSGNFFSALRLQPVAGRFITRRRSRASRRRAGGRAVARLLADAFRRRRRRRSARRFASTICQLTIIGVAPEDFQGTILALQFDLWVPATLAPALFAGSTELDRSQPARLLRDGPPPRRRGPKRARPAEFVVGDARAGGRVPRKQRPHQRRADPVLAGAARAADDVHHRARHPAGRDAAGAARGLRQHRQPRARARERALSRSRRAARARRRTRPA